MLFCFPIRITSLKNTFLPEKVISVGLSPETERRGNMVVSAIQNTVLPNNPERLHSNTIIL
jgi:hypothetical protein